MTCPYCLYKKTEVYNSRPNGKGAAVWRRRRCLSCLKAFSTQELVDLTSIWKIKTKGQIAPYSRAQLVASLMRACDHLDQPNEKAFYLLNSVEQGLRPIAAKNGMLIGNKDIVQAVSAILERYDAAAHVKYMSYRQVR